MKIIKTQHQNILPSLFQFLFGLLGQVISAAKEDIIKAYYPGYFMQSVESQIQTKQVQAEHDDSYQGKSAFMITAHSHMPSFICHASWGSCLYFHLQATLLLLVNSVVIR